MKTFKAPSSKANFFYVVLECESGGEMDNRPRLFAVCKNDKEAKNIIKDAFDSAKKTWGGKDKLIFNDEEMEIYTPDYSYICSYDYEKIDCKKYLDAHKREWKNEVGLLTSIDH